MCSDPRQISADVTVACRTCNDCVNARINGWVVRGMAEKAVAGSTYALTLTYRNLPCGAKPHGARILHYRHVRQFMTNLRQAAKRHYKKAVKISFIVAGEYGSKKKRAHWHMVLFSDVDLKSLSKLTDPKTGRTVPFAIDKRLDWGLWAHGLVYIQHPDKRGVRYVLKYAFKDQFNVKKSRSTARYKYAENYSTGLFRMSKTPPIGDRFLLQMIDRWRSDLRVPPSLNLRVPDYEQGYWFLVGRQRDMVAVAIHEINEQYRSRYGRDTPQFNSLVAELTKLDDEKTLETIYYGDDKKLEQDDEEWARFVAAYKVKPAPREYRLTSDKFAKCHGLRPCGTCAKASDRAAVEAHARRTVERIKHNASLDGSCHRDWPSFVDEYLVINEVENPFCRLSDPSKVWFANNPR